MKHVVHRLNQGVNAWLTAPESNAAGRLGIFRILYALFYLWHLSDYTPSTLHDLPTELFIRVMLNEWLPAPMPVLFFEGLAALVVAGLVFLLVGYRTYAATAVVGLAGALLESYYVCADFEHSSVFLMGYIPFFMLVAGDWGATYSFDAMLRRRRGQAVVAPTDTSPRFNLPIRAVLVVLAALFVSAGIHKAGPWSPWFSQDNVFGHLMLQSRVKAASRGTPLNPFANLIYDYRIFDVGLRWFVVLFEGTFFMVLFNRRLRAIYVSMAMTFHAVNAVLLGVTFTTIMIVYGLFIDWEAIKRRLWPAGWRLPRPTWSEPVLAVGTFVVAIVVAALWARTRIVQRVVTLDGWINFYTIWIPVLLPAVMWCAWSTCMLVRDATRRIAARRATTEASG